MVFFRSGQFADGTSAARVGMLFVISSGLVLATLSCSGTAGAGRRTSHGAALTPEENLAQLFAEAAAKGPVADNSRCHVCHLNYASEELAVKHAIANIGCEKCHGPSDPHCGDEDNITPPDIMIPVEQINPSCLAAGCHPKEKLTVLYHGLFLSGQSPQKHCTECHGKHRLVVRTRRWDRVTRELIHDDKVRMLDPKL